MAFSLALQAFADNTPVCVMVRAGLEHALPASFVNELFERESRQHYTRELLFSDVVDVMTGVVCQVFPSVNSAYHKLQDRFTVSRRALYDKLERVEPQVSRALLVETAQRLAPVVKALMPRGMKPLIPGFTTRIIDGNHLAASERRLKVLCDVAAGPLPGKSLVVYDPDARLIVDVVPCEDGHCQELALIADALERQRPGEVWISDRGLCTSVFVFQTMVNNAYFIVRQHATNVRWEEAGRLRRVGRTDRGVVYQQRVNLIEDGGRRVSARRITIRLDEPTEDGETEIHLFTNLPMRVSALTIARAYRGRWRLEGVFGELATALNCEIGSLGYPPAALFAFVIGLVAYNILSLTRTALASVHGEQEMEKISAYYLADELRGMMRGMQALVPPPVWTKHFGALTARQLAHSLQRLAAKVRLQCFRKSRRGPKKPRTPRTRFKGHTHVSTAQLLAAAKEK